MARSFWLLTWVVLAGLLTGCNCGRATKPCPTLCNSVCSDPVTDPNNCGACGARCATDICFQGGCVASCPAPTTVCGGTCLDLSSNPANCGACGNSCGAGRCVTGVCQCAPNEATCGL